MKVGRKWMQEKSFVPEGSKIVGSPLVKFDKIQAEFNNEVINEITSHEIVSEVNASQEKKSSRAKVEEFRMALINIIM
jgi:hypothetical protein